MSALLASRWDLHLTDVGGAAAVLDVTDLDACRTAFGGADAVAHLAAVPDPNASWAELLPANVVGAHQVAQAAADCGVRRLVLASSLRAAIRADELETAVFGALIALYADPDVIARAAGTQHQALAAQGRQRQAELRTIVVGNLAEVFGDGGDVGVGR